MGYRVLSVHENSPASNVTVIHNGERQLMVEERITGHALVPYFDFIISINGKRLVRRQERLSLFLPCNFFLFLNEFVL